MCAGCQIELSYVYLGEYPVGITVKAFGQGTQFMFGCYHLINWPRAKLQEGNQTATFIKILVNHFAW